MVTQFGAVCNGVADDTSAFNKAFAEIPAGSTLIVPTSCLVGSDGIGLQIPHSLIVQCTGWSSTTANIIVSPNLGPSADVIRIFSNNAGPMTGLKIYQCGIVPLSGSPGRFGINLDATSLSNGSGAISNFVIDFDKIGPFGGHAIGTTFNPSTTIADGVFNGTISDNILWNGIYLNNAGDDISIIHNTMAGKGPGVYANLAAGGASLVITGNSIDTCDGALYVAQGNDGVYFANNDIQPVNTGCSPTTHSATIDLDCVTFRCYGAVFEKNAVTDPTNTNIYRIGFAVNTIIDRGYPNLQSGQTVVLNTNLANGTTLRDQPWGIFSLAQILRDSGTGTQCQGWVYNAGPYMSGPCPSALSPQSNHETISGLFVAGTPNVTGCSLSGAVGTNTTGSFTSGVSGGCTFTLTFSPGAVYGWYCTAQNLTTPANTLTQVDSYTATSAAIAGTTVSGDRINYNCTPF